MFKIINANNDVIVTGLPSTNLDNAIALSGGTINGEYVTFGSNEYYYNDLELIPE